MSLDAGETHEEQVQTITKVGNRTKTGSQGGNTQGAKTAKIKQEMQNSWRRQVQHKPQHDANRKCTKILFISETELTCRVQSHDNISFKTQVILVSVE